MDREPRNGGGYWLLLGAVVAAHLLVIWVPKYNVLVDWPFHLARVWAMRHYEDVALFREAMAYSGDPVANLAIEMIALPLMGWLEPFTVGKIFLSAIVGVFAAGCHWLGKVLTGRANWTAPVAVFVVFNTTFLYGFVNSVMGSAMFLVAFAAWAGWRRSWTAGRWAVFALLATATFLSHLSGFVFLGLAIGVARLLEWRERRPGWGDAASVAALLPAVALQLYPWANKVRLGGGTPEWGTAARKAVILGTAFVSMSDWAAAVAVVLVGAGAAGAIWAAGARPARTPLVLGLAFLAVAVAFPKQMTAGGGSGADARFVPPGIVFLLLSLPLVAPKGRARVAVALLVAGMGVRLADTGWHLAEMSRRAEPELAALAQAPQHSRIYEIFFDAPEGTERRMSRGQLHLASYSLILTQSISSDFWAAQGVQPLYFRKPEDWATETETPHRYDPATLDRRLEKFDHIWGCRLDEAHRGYVESRGELVARGEACALWRVRR